MKRCSSRSHSCESRNPGVKSADQRTSGQGDAAPQPSRPENFTTAPREATAPFFLASLNDFPSDSSWNGRLPMRTLQDQACRLRLGNRRGSVKSSKIASGSSDYASAALLLKTRFLNSLVLVSRKFLLAPGSSSLSMFA
jgi:hypothetical protein